NQFAQNSFTLTPLKNIGSFIMNQSLTTSSLGQIDQNLQDIRDDLSTTQGE
ncbi:CvpA family protein, partial [Campylobacter coli]|nr:CvpA family protein [Campylobacter coli]